MPLTQLLFSFNGRINRATWWLTGLAMLVCMLALVFVVLGVGFAAGGAAGFAIILLIAFIPLLWISLAVGAKRLHDRDKSAWWVLLFYIVPSILQAVGDELAGLAYFVVMLASLAISLWGLVELGFLRGTTGPNQYGLDPLQQAA